MKQDAIDLVGFRVDTRRGGEAPLLLPSPDPPRERSAGGEDLVEQIEGFAGEVEKDLAGRQAHSPIAEGGTEGRVAVHDHVPGAEAERRRPRGSRAGPSRAAERVSHAAILDGGIGRNQSDMRLDTI
jgi:hypothetical protein